ncbi:MAG: transposase [Flavobacteriaceae bacterium]|nr:transposase [Flavobacteriaceae bacterium]
MLSESVHAEKKKESSVGQSVEPEVVPVARPVGLIAKRRRFTTEYKLRVLEEADQCTEPGQIGLLLRREGLYSNSLYNWRKWRDKLTSKKDNAVSSVRDLRNENARLKRENARLHLKLKKADALLDLQKKASEILKMADLDESEND